MSLRRNLGPIVVGLLALVLVGCGTSADTSSLEGTTMTVYYSPDCSCCGRYIDYLEDNGMNVVSKKTRSMESIRMEQGVPRDARSCHTGVVGDYFVEGHVPLEAIAELTRNQPDLAGIALPGARKHSPGMGPATGSDLSILSVKKNGQMAGQFTTVQY